MSKPETMTLSDLAHAIEDREARKLDVIAPANQLAVLPKTESHDSPLLIHTAPGSTIQPMEISDLAHSQIASWTPMGTRYYDHVRAEEPELWADNVNTWLGRGDRGRMLRMLREPEPVISGPHSIRPQPAVQLRAFLSDQFGRYEDVHLLTPVLQRIHDRNWQVLHCALTPRRMHVRVGFPMMQGEVKVGDPVMAGAAFTNSEVGCSLWKFEFFVERLVCLNGMKFSEKFAGFTKRHIVGRQAAGWLSASTLALENALLQSQVGDTLEMMNDEREFQRVLALMKDTADQEMEQPVAAVQVLRQRVGLSENETNAVEGNLVRGGDVTLWGLVNALTATARDLPDFDRRAELEDAAGKLMTQERSWKHYTHAEAA